jgi:mannose-6-phosphate isomerase
MMSPGMEREHDERPWGSYTVLEEGPGFKVKQITVSPGRRLSYQVHEQRAEHWFVVSGTGLVTLDGTDQELVAGESLDVPIKGAHRMANPGDETLVFIEVQTGDYLGEDDITRLEDDFGRNA